MYLYHFYDKRTGPFRSLTSISTDEAKRVMEQIKKERPNSLCAQRHDHYVEYRHNCEQILKTEFAKKAKISSASLAKLGKRANVTTDVLERICKALNCEIADIVEIKDSSEVDK